MKTFAAFLAAVFLSFPISAANLLNNPNFNSNVAGWTASSSTILSASWNGIDAIGSTTSGSVTIRNTTDFANGAGPYLGQCIAVTAGAAYDIAAKIHIPGNQDRTGYVSTYVAFYDAPGCGETFLTNFGGDGPFAPTGRFIGSGTTNIIAPAGARSASVGVITVKNQSGGSFEASVDDIFFGPTGGCVPAATQMCLANSRFAVSADFQTPDGTFGIGNAIQLTADSGYFWFFGPDNVEIIVKVLNACGGAGPRYWVFSGGLTNVRVILTIDDRETGQRKTYENPQGRAFAPIQDTNAFATCP
jgi:hypothetical protein